MSQGQLLKTITDKEKGFLRSGDLIVWSAALNLEYVIEVLLHFVSVYLILNISIRNVGFCYSQFCYSRFRLFTDLKTANNEGKLLFLPKIALFRLKIQDLVFAVLDLWGTPANSEENLYLYYRSHWDCVKLLYRTTRLVKDVNNLSDRFFYSYNSTTTFPKHGKRDR